MSSTADAHRNPIMAFFQGNTIISPQRKRIIAIEPTFTQLFARWQAFMANEAGVASQLQREVIAGIEQSRKTDSGSSS